MAFPKNLRIQGCEFELFEDGSARITLRTMFSNRYITVSFESAQVAEIRRHLDLRTHPRCDTVVATNRREENES